VSAQKRRRTPKSRPRRPGASAPARRFPWTGAIVVLALLAAATGAWLVFGPGPGPREGGTETTVILKHGSGLQQISAALAEAGVIRSAPVFTLYAKLSGGGRRLRAGEYAIPARASVAQILSMIRNARIVRHLVTIPEGITVQMAMDILNKNPVLTGEATAPPEGSILPQTYDVERGEDRATVLQAMRDAQSQLLTRLWDQRKAGLPYKTPEQAVALASIVEKETAKPAERPHVAAVYLNRLAAGMRLESDPTIIYGLTRGRPLGRSLTHAEVVRPTAYNTYVITGLPPTPIANPGQASLEAALDPSDSRDLFFVADGTGGHVFSTNFEEHSRNVARWRTIAQAAKREASR
jgi:UPF0755 protein